MKESEDVKRFKKNNERLLEKYETKINFSETGDFGCLYQIEFNSDLKGGNIDFWGLGWLGIFVWDYKREKELMNVLIDPDEKEERKHALKKFQQLVE